MPKPLPPKSNGGGEGGAEDEARAAFTGMDIGLNLLVSVMACGAAGYGLDRWLGWTPWAMLVGGFLGFGAWLVTVWRMMNAARK